MNRNNEYLELIEELDNKSQGIDNLYKKANKRLIKKQIVSISTTALSAVASLLIIFVVLINNVNSFAYACGGVPVIKDLAKMVALSPSLSAAVEHQYVQPIELSKTQDDITAKIEYVIVDQKQLNIFYSLQSDKFDKLNADVDLLEDDNHIGGTLSYGETNEDKLQKITLDCIDSNVPETVSIKLKVRDLKEAYNEMPLPNTNDDYMIDDLDDDYEEPEYLTEFVFNINLDPDYTAQGQIIDLNRTFDIDGQKLIITTVEVYPTHMRINFKDVEKNTKWLKALNLYVTDDKGNTFDKVSNGITATGDADTPMMVSHRVESGFFSRSKSFTLYIDGISWADKENNRIKVDLKNNTYDKCPDFMSLYKTTQYKDGWKVDFIVDSIKENHSFNNFNFYYDENGTQYHIEHSSSTYSPLDDNGNVIVKENQFIESIYLEGYDKDVVYLEPICTEINKLDIPIKIKIK